MKRILITIAALVALAPPARAQTTAALLDSLQYGAFRYAWYQANPANGLIRDRSTSGSPASIAATGFGLSAICIGVDHGWVSRADAATRGQIIEAVNLFRAKVVDVSTESLTVEATGTPGKLDALYRLLEPYGIREIAQSGMVTLARGPRGIVK